MNLNEFINEVKENIRDYLPEEYADAEIEVRDVQKLNVTYPSLTVRKEDQEITASVDLQMFFSEYEKGRDFDEVLGEIAEVSIQQPESLDVRTFNDYEQVKDKLFVRVSDAETNSELLKNVPHKEENGLAITYHILVDINEYGTGSVMINHQLLKDLGVSPEKLHEDAVVNSAKIMEPSIAPMESMIMRMMGMEPEPEMQPDFGTALENLSFENSGMIVLSNRTGVNGAAVIVYPDLLKQISDKVQMNFFILPSSTHEVILVPDNGSFNVKDLSAMVKEINMSEVSPKDKLSDTVYHYDSKEHLLEKAVDFEERTAEKQEASKVKHRKEKDWER